MGAQSLPAHALVPEAIIIKLDKPGRQHREKAQIFLAQTVCWELMLALRKNRLDRFYTCVLMEITVNSEVNRQMSQLQQHVAIKQYLDQWLVEVESAICESRHKAAKKFLITFENEVHPLSLAQLSRLRTFLYRELELPLHVKAPRPSYEGAE